MFMQYFAAQKDENETGSDFKPFEGNFFEQQVEVKAGQRANECCEADERRCQPDVYTHEIHGAAHDQRVYAGGDTDEKNDFECELFLKVLLGLVVAFDGVNDDFQSEQKKDSEGNPMINRFDKTVN